MKPRPLLSLMLVLLATAAGALDRGFLSAGTVASRGDWTLTLRADRFEGAAPPAHRGEPAPATLEPEGPITRSPLDYPVVVLQGPGGKVWEFSTLTAEGETAGVAWLRLEPDWDGDGRPEVAGRFHQGYRIGQGIRPSGIVSIVDRLFLPGPSGWKAEVELGAIVGDEGGGEIRGLSVLLSPGKPPRPTEWSWSEAEGAEAGTKTITFSVAPQVWTDGALTDIKRTTTTATLTTAPDSESVAADPQWPRVTLNDDRVNLRAGANQTFPSLGLLSRGTVLLVKGMDSEPGVSGNLRSPWLKVEPASGPLKGQIGWVFAHFCAPAP